MRSNVEWRRHGCGQLIGPRESCARCANAARARLHAQGECDSEFRETLRIVKRVGRDPNELHEKSARDICNDAVRSGELVLRERVKHSDALEWTGVDFGYGDKTAVVRATVFPGGTYRIDDVEELPKSPVSSTPDPRTLLSHVCSAATEAHRLTGVVPYAVATTQEPEVPWFEWYEPRNLRPGVDPEAY